MTTFPQRPVYDVEWSDSDLQQTSRDTKEKTTIYGWPAHIIGFPVSPS